MTLVSLTAGPYEAHIDADNAGLYALTHIGTDCVVPADQLPGAYPGAVLGPWPNRLTGAAYRWAGEEHRLAVNEPSTGAALHGLLDQVSFRVTSSSPRHVSLCGVLEASVGYPFRLEIGVDYSLTPETGLFTTLSARRTSDTTGAAPWGAGFHPYLCIGDGTADDWSLQVPVDVDSVMSSALSKGVGLAGQTLDDTFRTRTPGGWTAGLTDLRHPRGVLLHSATPWVQIYSADHHGRPGVAVEPMTCPPEAFASGTDVISLAPGQLHRIQYRIECWSDR